MTTANVSRRQSHTFCRAASAAAYAPACIIRILDTALLAVSILIALVQVNLLVIPG